MSSAELTALCGTGVGEDVSDGRPVQPGGPAQLPESDGSVPAENASDGNESEAAGLSEMRKLFESFESMKEGTESSQLGFLTLGELFDKFGDGMESEAAPSEFRRLLDRLEIVSDGNVSSPFTLMELFEKLSVVSDGKESAAEVRRLFEMLEIVSGGNESTTTSPVTYGELPVAGGDLSDGSGSSPVTLEEMPVAGGDVSDGSGSSPVTLEELFDRFSAASDGNESTTTSLMTYVEPPVAGGDVSDGNESSTFTLERLLQETSALSDGNESSTFTLERLLQETSALSDGNESVLGMPVEPDRSLESLPVVSGGGEAALERSLEADRVPEKWTAAGDSNGEASDDVSTAPPAGASTSAQPPAVPQTPLDPVAPMAPAAERALAGPDEVAGPAAAALEPVEEARCPGVGAGHAAASPACLRRCPHLCRALEDIAQGRTEMCAHSAFLACLTEPGGYDLCSPVLEGLVPFRFTSAEELASVCDDRIALLA